MNGYKQWVWVVSLLFLLQTNSKGAIIAQWDNFAGSGNLSTGLAADQGSGELMASSGDSVAPVGNPAPSLAVVAGTFTIQLSGTGLSGFTLSYDGIATGTAVTQLWEWSTDGSTYSSSGIASEPADLTDTVHWSTESVDFSDVTELDGAAVIYLRNTVGSAGGFDNISVQAVPEPVNYALMVFGLGLVSVWIYKKYNLMQA